MKKPEETDAVSGVKHRHDNSVATHKCAHANKSIIYILLCKEKAPIYKLSCSIASKTPQICHYKHERKTSRLFVVQHERRL